MVEPFMTRVAFTPVMVPLVKSTLPPTDQVPEPMEMDGVPLAFLLKLIEPVIVTAGLLVAQSSVSAPASVVWTRRLPLSIRLPDMIKT